MIKIWRLFSAKWLNCKIKYSHKMRNLQYVAVTTDFVAVTTDSIAIATHYVGLACPAGTVNTMGIHTPLYMKAAWGVTPPPTGRPPTRAGGVP